MKQPDGSQQAGGAASASVHSGPVAGQHYATLPASLQPPQLLHHAYPVAQQHVAHVQPPPALHAQPLTATGETGPDAPTRNSMEIPVGSVLGIPVKLHVLLPAITVLYTVNAWLMSTAAAVFMFLLTGPVLYGSVFIHELGHCLAARRVGGHVDGILLWPLGGLAYIGHSGAAKDDLIIAAAGPLTHAPQAAVWGIFFAIANAAKRPLWKWLCAAALKMQLTLLVFNLLSPAYPLDGGRIVVDLMSLRRVPLERAARITGALSFLTGAGICIYALSVAAWFTLPVGVWVIMQASELMQKVKRGEARSHPMFVHYEQQQSQPPNGAQLA